MIKVAIVKAGREDDLAAMVNAKIQEGWRPSGGPYFCPYDDQRQHCWAIEIDITNDKRAEPIPYKAVERLYNELCPGLIKSRVLNETKKAGIRRLWKFASEKQGTDREEIKKYLTVFFQAAQEDPFLRGEIQNPGHSNFRGGDLAMICRDSWIARIME